MLRILLLAALVAPAAVAQTTTGALTADDDTLSTGEFADAIEVNVAAGETVTAVLTADGFDPWIFLKDEAGRQEDNDDCEGDRTRSCATFVATEAGTVRIVVTSFAPHETGRYRLEVTTGNAGGPSPR